MKRQDSGSGDGKYYRQAHLSTDNPVVFCLLPHKIVWPDARGFSLIELMIVVAIIGIIAAIAYPSYERSVLKSHRSDAETLLSQDSQILERCYTQYFRYNSAQCSPSAASLPASTQFGYYTLTEPPAVTTDTYTLTVTAVGTQLNDTDCRTFSLDNTGNKTSTNSAGALNTSTCWGH